MEVASDAIPFNIAISADGAKIVASFADDSIRIWSMDTGQVHNFF